MRRDSPPHHYRERIARPPVPRVLGAITAPVYGVGIRLCNRRFDSGRGVRRVDAPVISVGNLTAGGTGKSPMVLWLASLLVDQGITPGVATRGYKSKPGQTGDEQKEMHGRMPDLAIEADPVRTAGARRLIDRGCDVVLLDDGFQHRRLARDLDIVLLDATRPVFDDYLLPLGFLREPAASLDRAHAVVITRCESADAETIDQIERFAMKINPKLLVIRAEHRWDGLDVGGEFVPVNTLAGRRVVLACGIGNPGAFIANAEARGAQISDRMIRPDHHDWSASDVRHLRAVCDEQTGLLTTAKDWVKLAHHMPRSSRGFDVIVPRLSIGITDNGADLRALVLRAAERARTASA